MSKDKVKLTPNMSMIQYHIRASGLSVTALAERIKYDRAHLSKVLHGKHPMTNEMIGKLANAFNVEIQELLTEQSQSIINELNIELIAFLKSNQQMNWKAFVAISDRLGHLHPGDTDREISEGQQADMDLLEEGDAPEAYKQ